VCGTVRVRHWSRKRILRTVDGIRVWCARRRGRDPYGARVSSMRLKYTYKTLESTARRQTGIPNTDGIRRLGGKPEDRIPTAWLEKPTVCVAATVYPGAASLRARRVDDARDVIVSTRADGRA
jgi:hypothetical protein